MQDKDFDKIFGRRIRQIPGANYEESNWNALSARLDAYKQRRWKWLLPAQLLLFFLLAAGNIFWWYQWRAVSLEQRDFKTGSIRYFKNDTLVKTTVVYQFDTVYRSVSVIRAFDANKFIAKPASEIAGIAQPEPPLFDRGLHSDKPVVQQNLPAGILPVEHVVDSLEQQSAIGTAKVQDALAQQPVGGAAASGRPRVFGIQEDTSVQAPRSVAGPVGLRQDSAFEQLLQTIPLPEKKRPPLIYFARPRLSFASGWGTPLLPGKISGSMLLLHVGADVEIARRLRLGIETGYDRARLKSARLDGINTFPDPGGDFKLKYWEVYNLPAISYALKLRYEMPLLHSWSSYISFGAQAATLLPFDAEFEFKNQVNSLELHVPMQNGSATRFQGIAAALGFENRLNLHTSLGFEVCLLHRLDKMVRLPDNQAGFKTRLCYHF